MLSLTRKTDYALVALAFLGRRHHEQQDPVSARVIAEQFGLPLPLLMNLLKDLCKAGVVDSVRGKNGGYVLAIDPKQVNLLEIMTIIDGPFRFAACTDGLPIVGQGCPIAEGCPIRTPVRKLHQRLEALLEQTTLEELLTDSDGDGSFDTVPLTTAGL